MGMRAATPHHVNGLFDGRAARWLLGWLAGHRRLLHMVQLGAIGFIGLIVLGQVLYPADRALPFLRLGGIPVGLQSRQEIVRRLDDFANEDQVTIKTPSREWTVSWQSLGLSVDREASADVALAYQWWERWLPFSSVARVLQSQATSMIALVDQDRVQAFAGKVVTEDKAAARDATIGIDHGRVVIDSAKNGYQYELDEVERQVRALPMVAQSTLNLVPEAVASVRSDDELQGLVQEAEGMLSREVVLRVGDKTYKPDRAARGSWLLFQEDPEAHKLRLLVNKEGVRNYLKSIDSDLKLEPGTAKVTLLDGQEVARSEAQAGKSVAVDSAVAAIEGRLTGQVVAAEPVALSLVDVPPKIEYEQTFSKASSGLQSLVDEWRQNNYGDYGIIVRELTGERRYAEWQPDKPFVTASTFKMFVVYNALTKIQQGTLQRDQMTDIGWTVQDCMVEVIVNSTNPCAISLQNLLGWEELDVFLRESGFTATTLNNRTGSNVDKYSTIRDETNFFLRLYSGTLMKAEDNEFLLGLMKRQIWRAGIPSGVPRGTVVADKVGLYGAWVHDVAIVYGPKSTFILGIMSRGGSDPQFADLSRRVYNFFNQ